MRPAYPTLAGARGAAAEDDRNQANALVRQRARLRRSIHAIGEVPFTSFGVASQRACA
jgi:hypothetical protein